MYKHIIIIDSTARKTKQIFLKYIPHHNQSLSQRDSGKASNKESEGNRLVSNTWVSNMKQSISNPVPYTL